MKRLLLGALMVLVSLFGISAYAESQNDTPTMSAMRNAVNVSQVTANPTTGAVNELSDTVYDLETVYAWNSVYDLDAVYDLDTVYDW